MAQKLWASNVIIQESVIFLTAKWSATSISARNSQPDFVDPNGLGLQDS